MISDSIRGNNMCGIADDTPLWRVYKLEYMESAISGRENTLVKPEQWDDPFENFMGQCKAVIQPGGMKVALRGIYGAFYGQCWTRAEQETDATWRIYTPHVKGQGANQLGARVRVLAGKLFDTIYDAGDPHISLKAFLGSVEYRDEEQIRAMIRNEGGPMTFDGSGLSQARALMVKRLEFEHEQEVRLLYNRIDVKTAAHNLATFPIDPSALFDETVLDPRLEAAEAAAFESSFRSAGYTGDIRQSQLYRLPNFPDLVIDY